MALLQPLLLEVWSVDQQHQRQLRHDLEMKNVSPHPRPTEPDLHFRGFPPDSLAH